ncbi:MAG: DarT ssDNA thymidine ADP-ribosyltransferase family protein, partial [Erysipelotrichaceae bacterium]
MTYRDIIENNKKISAVSWWVNFAFHYTDVSNAVNILKTGKLFSRMKAENSNLMVNDNASRQVIDMTVSGVQSYVRFYFRPLTPTQYYNEGYKHPQLRFHGEDNANIPVPIFFAFNLEKLLNDGNTQFSNLSQAGYGSVLRK